MAIYYGNSPQNANYRGRVEITEVIPHPENNTSTITWNFKVYRADGYSSSYNRTSGNVISFSVDGAAVTPSWSASTVSMSGATSEANAVLLAYGQFDVAHDGNGQKAFSFSARYYNSNSSTIGSSSAPLNVSGVFTCTTIQLGTQIYADQAEVTLTSALVARYVNFSMPRTNSSYTHTLGYSFNGRDTVWFASGVGESYAWAIPTNSSFAPLCTNAMSANCVFYCVTMSGETQIGSTSCTVKINLEPYTLNASAAPMPYGDHNTWGFIQNVNTARMQFAMTSVNGATFKKAYLNGYEISGNTYTWDSLPYAGTYEGTWVVEDSRGVSKSGTYSFEVQAYDRPSLNVISIYRCNADGTWNTSGTYVYAEVSPSLVPVGEHNVIQSIYAEYSATSGQYGTSPQYAFTYDATSQTYKAIIGDGNLSSVSKWYVALVIIDSISYSSAEQVIPEETVSIHERPYNKGVGIGTYCDADEKFKINGAWAMYHGTHSIDAIADISASADNGYVVYESGLKVAWKKVTLIEFALNQQYGSLWLNYAACGNLPTTFNAPPVIQAQWASDTAIAWVSNIIGASATSWGAVTLMAGANYSISGTLLLMAIGV